MLGFARFYSGKSSTCRGNARFRSFSWENVNFTVVTRGRVGFTRKKGILNGFCHVPLDFARRNILTVVTSGLVRVLFGKYGCYRGHARFCLEKVILTVDTTGFVRFCSGKRVSPLLRVVWIGKEGATMVGLGFVRIQRLLPW